MLDKKAIIYLHGFNSASLDLQGKLLTSKEKLKVMQDYCAAKEILFFTPNVDYRNFQGIIDAMLNQWRQYKAQSFDVLFMGSSMGGFSSEYLALKTGSKAILINPAITPSQLLPKFIGVEANFETGQPYQWQQAQCDQFQTYETELQNSDVNLDLIVLLDKGDELLDSEIAYLKYKDSAKVYMYDGGSHSFEHMRQALPVIDQVIFA